MRRQKPNGSFDPKTPRNDDKELPFLAVAERQERSDPVVEAQSAMLWVCQAKEKNPRAVKPEQQDC